MLEFQVIRVKGGSVASIDCLANVKYYFGKLVFWDVKSGFCCDNLCGIPVCVCLFVLWRRECEFFRLCPIVYALGYECLIIIIISIA